MQSTLVLNASYEPLSIVSGRRGVKMILNGRASSLDDSEVVFNSEDISIPVPYVVLLNRYVRKDAFTKKPRFSRRGVLVRDGFACTYCGNYADTIDHVIPRMDGGESTYENCVAACGPCNRKKGHKTLKEMGWNINFKPTAPSLFTTMLGKARSNERQLEAWGRYISMFQPELAKSN